MKKKLIHLSMTLAGFVLGLFLSSLLLPLIVQLVCPASAAVSLIVTSRATMFYIFAAWALFIATFGFIAGFDSGNRVRTILLSVATGVCVVCLTLLIQKQLIGTGIRVGQELLPNNPVTVTMESLHLERGPLLGGIAVCLISFILRRTSKSRA